MFKKRSITYKLPFILNKNIPILPGEIVAHQISFPPQRTIDFKHALNSGDSTKTLICVLGHVNGIADFLRGSILVAQYAKHFNIHFKMNVSRHAINECLLVKSEPIFPKKIHTLMLNHKYTHLNYYISSLIQHFLTTDETELYIYSNLFYDRNLLTDDIKQYINTFFTFKPSYADELGRLFTFSQYRVLHIRCKDSEFTTAFEDNHLFTEIVKLQLSSPVIVISNNHHLKHTLHNLFGFYMMDAPSYHTAFTHNYQNLYSTIMEYMVLTKSMSTYCFSYYGHGSGFSEQCSILNSVPYQSIYLPDNMPTHPTILLSYYASLLEPPIVTGESIRGSISFVLWGIRDEVVLNSIQSLKNIHMEPFHVYYEKDYSSQWDMIHQHLVTHDYVCVTTPNTIYENNQLFHYLTSVQQYDILLPRDGIETTGVNFNFMWIRSNECTRSLFSGREDYVSILTKLNMQRLPLHLFPTWSYYTTYKITPYMIQGGDKHQWIQHKKWFPLKKIKISNQASNDLFYQLEGTLRLLAIHLDHQASYVMTESHPYLKEAIQSIVSEKGSSIKEEIRPFQSIQDKDIIHSYDGVHYNRGHTLLPNMDIQSFESCLPVLRKAFVKPLPLPTYDRTRINVVCHADVYEPLKEVIQTFEKYNHYRIIVYTKDSVECHPNTIIYEDTSLQALSDCIHADILLMSYTSLTIAAHLLADEKQHVLYTTDITPYRHRVLKKCIYFKDL